MNWREWLFYGLCVWFVGGAILDGIFDFSGNRAKAMPEMNICTLDYRAAYLETHENDAALRQECPFGLSNQPMFVIHKHWDEIDKIMESFRKD